MPRCFQARVPQTYKNKGETRARRETVLATESPAVAVARPHTLHGKGSQCAQCQSERAVAPERVRQRVGVRFFRGKKHSRCRGWGRAARSAITSSRTVLSCKTQDTAGTLFHRGLRQIRSHGVKRANVCADTTKRSGCQSRQSGTKQKVSRHFHQGSRSIEPEQPCDSVAGGRKQWRERWGRGAVKRAPLRKRKQRLGG